MSSWQHRGKDERLRAAAELENQPPRALSVRRDRRASALWRADAGEVSGRVPARAREVAPLKRAGLIDVISQLVRNRPLLEASAGDRRGGAAGAPWPVAVCSLGYECGAGLFVIAVPGITKDSHPDPARSRPSSSIRGVVVVDRHVVTEESCTPLPLKIVSRSQGATRQRGVLRGRDEATRPQDRLQGRIRPDRGGGLTRRRWGHHARSCRGILGVRGLPGCSHRADSHEPRLRHRISHSRRSFDCR